MKRKVFFWLLVLTLIGLPLFGACAEQAAEPTPTPTPEAAEPEVIELRYNHMSPPGPLYDGIHGKWVDEVMERCGGKVKITTYFVGQLSPPEESYNSLLTGLADIATLHAPLNQGRFPCIEVMQMPRIETTCAHTSRVAWELYQAFPEIQAEFAETKVLSVYGFREPTSLCLGTATKPIYTMEDLEGLKIAAPGVWPSKKVSLLGASPMSLFEGDYYVSLEKKVLDGAIMDPGQLEDFNLREVIKYLNLTNFGFMPLWLSMSWDAWNSLPTDVQEVFEEVGGEYFGDIVDSYTSMQSWRAIDTAVAEYGMEVIELTPEELARWNVVIEPVRDEFVAELEAKGLPGEELLEEADQLYIKYAE